MPPRPPRGPNVDNPFPITTIEAPEDPNVENSETHDVPVVTPNQHLSLWTHYILAMAPFDSLSSRNDPVYLHDIVGEVAPTNDAEEGGLFKGSITDNMPLTERTLPTSLRPVGVDTRTQAEKDRTFESLLPPTSMWNFSALKANLGNDPEKERVLRLNNVVHGSHFHRGTVETVFSWGMGTVPGQAKKTNKKGEFAYGTSGKFDRSGQENSKPLAGVGNPPKGKGEK
jgi:hypothetical protein